MSLKFSIEFLPATYGDCIWIEYGEADTPYRVLIDGGTKGTRDAILAKLKQLPEEQRTFELIVNTHYDKDHIDGILGLLEMKTLPFKTRDVWFNGWKHLLAQDEIEHFGAIMAEDLTACIASHKLPWNKCFEEKAVVAPANGDLPVKTLQGGLKLTILSPYPDNLADLKKVWYDEVTKKGRVPGYGMPPPPPPDSEIERFGPDALDIEALNAIPFKPDRAEGNGSSIALLAQFGGKSALLVGDALPTVVLRSLERLHPDGKFPVDLFKLSHHGSRGNTGPGLIEKLACSRYVISTNGSIYGHPHRETIAWLIKRGGRSPQINFNYKTCHNEMWQNAALQTLFNYKTVYPETTGITINLL